MPSDTRAARRHSSGGDPASPVREFFSALREPMTYSPWNDYLIFGFLWGLPIPVFSVSIDLWATGEAFSIGRILHHPFHLFFLLHPLLFAVIFGAMGTVRRHKEMKIRGLLAELRKSIDDLTEANGKLKELDHLKAQFIANVTHELKTPLVAIRGYNESILEGRFGPLTDKQRDGLGVAVRNVDRLQKLIEELLDFGRIDSGDFKLDFTEFDLVPLIEGTFKDFRPQAEEKRLAIQIRMPESLPARADREKISCVLRNLVSNAVKFSPEGTAVGLNARIGEEDGQILITVWDRGPGIPTAAQKYLFTRFWQADGSTRRRYGGSGLGLAISKGILDAHGSTLQVVSSEGAGTMVHFTLPLAGSAKESDHDRRAAAHPGR